MVVSRFVSTVCLKELNVNVNALYTSCRLKSTSSDSRAISAIAELLVLVSPEVLVFVSVRPTNISLMMAKIKSGVAEEQTSLMPR